jgi:hypothetical protein
MQELVSTSGWPAVDAEAATRADVVLSASADELVLLRYSPSFRMWYACGCLAESIGDDAGASDARVTWNGIRYMDDASIAYIHLEDLPCHIPRQWDMFYEALSQRTVLSRACE